MAPTVGEGAGANGIDLKKVSANSYRVDINREKTGWTKIGRKKQYGRKLTDLSINAVPQVVCVVIGVSGNKYFQTAHTRHTCELSQKVSECIEEARTRHVDHWALRVGKPERSKHYTNSPSRKQS